MKLPIYLDHHATTPVDPKALDEMLPYFTERFGNAASTAHVFGWEAEEAVEIAAERVAGLIGAKSPEIIWTSGTTESVNLALAGGFLARPEKNHLITGATEHSSVLETARALQARGCRVTYLPVDGHGRIHPEDVRRAIDDKTLMVSLMAANNEVGTQHPLADIGQITREKGVWFHVDAAQGCGKMPLDVGSMKIDLMSMSAHKAYGPKGIGALYVRHRDPHVSLKPILYGGSHQNGLRPGTLPVPLIVGMGKAFELAGTQLTQEMERLRGLRERLFQGILHELDDVLLNGPPVERLPGNLNLSFPGVSASDFLMALRDIAVSSGSACRTGSTKPSHVLQAMGVGEDRSLSSIRFGIGRFNTEEEIDFVIGQVVQVVKRLRQPS